MKYTTKCIDCQKQRYELPNFTLRLNQSLSFISSFNDSFVGDEKASMVDVQWQNRVTFLIAVKCEIFKLNSRYTSAFCLTLSDSVSSCNSRTWYIWDNETKCQSTTEIVEWKKNCRTHPTVACHFETVTIGWFVSIDDFAILGTLVRDRPSDRCRLN